MMDEWESYRVPKDDCLYVRKTDHLADQVAVAKAWGEKLAELEADHLAVNAGEDQSQTSNH